MEKKKLTYAEAISRLEEIVNRVEDNEQDIDCLTDLLKEAQKLVKFCKEKLYKVDSDVKKILEEE